MVKQIPREALTQLCQAKFDEAWKRVIGADKMLALRGEAAKVIEEYMKLLAEELGLK